MDAAMAGNKKSRPHSPNPHDRTRIGKGNHRDCTLVEEGERQAELERQRWTAQMEQWDREEAERRTAKALKESKEELLGIIEMWATSKRLEEFFADAEHKLKNLAEGERTRSMERLRRARKLIGSTDALERFQSWKAPEER